MASFPGSCCSNASCKTTHVSFRSGLALLRYASFKYTHFLMREVGPFLTCISAHILLWSSDGDQRDKERRRRRHGSPSDEEDPHKSHKRKDYESSRRGDKVSAVCVLVLCLGAVTL